MAAYRLCRKKRLVATIAIGLAIGFICLIAGCSEKQAGKKDAAKKAKESKTATESTTATAESKISAAGSPPTESKTAAAPFQDEPAAHALYNQMIEALHKADSLSFVSRSKFEGKNDSQEFTYKAWLKKPNYFRVEAQSSTPERDGILVGDGNTLWIYWPEGRPQMFGDEDTEADKQKRLTSYMKHPAPLASHSIAHEVMYIGGITILDLSTFHGYTDPLQQYIDGVKSLPDEKVGDEECEGIEVSIMKHQRSWYLWLSKRDHIPRKLKEIVRVSYDLIITEDWSSVTLNADMPETLFAWKPPEGWTQWVRPPIEIGLLKPGTKAPDFELALADGNKIKLSDYRGKTVWFYVWRAG
jgi:outer membrane lipoprotein-sorting protein